jgi:hypothetical protein
MSTNLLPTPAAARAELARRALPKAERGPAKCPKAQRLGGAELRLLAEEKAAKRTTAKKAAQARAAKPAPAKKSAPKGCPIKRICAEWADSQVPDKAAHMADWWSEYKHATAWFRALNEAA